MSRASFHQPHTSSAATRRSRSSAMTLVEMLLALTITSLIALTAGGMLTAVTYGSAERTDLRSLVVRQELIANRLAAAIRTSYQVLECDNDKLVLWVTDANNDQKPQLGEVRWLELDSDTQVITHACVKFPGTLTQEQLAVLNKDYINGASRTVQTAAASAYVVTETWADKVSDWLLAAGDSQVNKSRLVNFRVTFTLDGKQPQTIVGAAALRSQ